MEKLETAFLVFCGVAASLTIGAVVAVILILTVGLARMVLG